LRFEIYKTESHSGYGWLVFQGHDLITASGDFVEDSNAAIANAKEEIDSLLELADCVEISGGFAIDTWDD
jgi:hypothetical protein